LKIRYLKSPPLGLPLLRAIQADPLGVAQRLQREHGDLVGLRILFQHVFYAFHPEAARQVLVEHQEHSVKEARQMRIFRSVQGRNVLTTEGASWQRQRRILMPQFAPRKVAGYLGLMAEATAEGIAAQLPAAAGDSGLIDADALTTRLTMDVILRTLFTYRASRAESDELSRCIRALTRQSMRELFWLFAPPNWLPFPGRRAKLAQRAMLHGFIAAQIRARRGAAADPQRAQDVLGLLLAARDEAGGARAALSDEEIHDNCLVMFLAGHDTSATALAWWLGLMATHPPIAERVRAEVRGADDASPERRAGPTQLPLLNATLKEALRLYPPATATFSRVAQRRVRVGDATLPKGAIVAIPIWHIQRDARWFAHPERFDPERFLPGAAEIARGAFLPFGGGPHFCLGQYFALAELALIAARLIRDYDLALPAGAALPDAVVDMTLKPKSPLWVRFTRRAADLQ